MVIITFFALAAGSALYFLKAFLDSRRFLEHAERAVSAPLGDYAPPVTLICPCKGLDAELELNLRSLLDQDYPDYEVLFVVAEESDPAQAVCARLAQQSRRPARVVIAGLSEGRGEKVHNLEVGVDAARPESEVFVFADSDGRPHKKWVRRLVARLAQPGTGAATTFRWYIPEPNFLSGLQSAWNAVTGAYFIWEGERRNCWGGGTALRRSTFEQANVRRFWAGCVSDDLMLSRALREAGMKIAFVPRCLVATHHPITWRKFLAFGTRQLTVMRVYEATTWRRGFLLLMLYLATMLLGLGLATARLTSAPAVSVAVLAGIAFSWALMAAKGWVWLKAVRLLVPEHSAELWRGRWAPTVLAPLAPMVLAVNFIQSAVRRDFVWRGVTYRLDGPWKTEILSRD